MLTWSSYALDVDAKVLTSPATVRLSPAETRVFASLIVASGTYVSLEELVAEAGSTVSTTYWIIGTLVRKLRDAGVERVVECKNKHGWRLIPDPKPRNVREEVLATLLVDEFEATGPHARVVAVKIEELYR